MALSEAWMAGTATASDEAGDSEAARGSAADCSCAFSVETAVSTEMALSEAWMAGTATASDEAGDSEAARGSAADCRNGAL